jgi:hypothetical protein
MATDTPMARHRSLVATILPLRGVSARRRGRPPRPASAGLLTGYCAVAATTALAVAAGAARRPGLGLALLGAAVLAVAVRTAASAAPGVGALGWLFYAGFITGRHADLAWHGTASLGPLAVLEGAAAAGVALSWLRGHLARRRSSSGPPARQPLAPVVSLASARAARRKHRA